MSSKSFHVELDGQASGTLPLDTKLATGKHHIVLSHQKENIKIDFHPHVYTNGFVIWQVKREKKQWFIDNLGFRKVKRKK